MFVHHYFTDDKDNLKKVSKESHFHQGPPWGKSNNNNNDRNK